LFLLHIWRHHRGIGQPPSLQRPGPPFGESHNFRERLLDSVHEASYGLSAVVVHLHWWEDVYMFQQIVPRIQVHLLVLTIEAGWQG
jgi:hypothetical protein